MTDETAMPTGKSGRRAKDDIVDAEIVDEPVATTAAEPKPKSEAKPKPEAAAESAPPQQVVYIHAPAAPAKKGNRGVGAVIAVVSGVLYTALLALAQALIGLLTVGRLSFAFLGDARFYIPALFFVIGFVLLVLILNRAAWWAYIVGSLLLAVFVYFGTIGVGLLGQGVIAHTPDEATAMFHAALRSPFVIASALIAREVAMWVAAGIAARGRRLKARNAEAYADYVQELAEKQAEHAPGAAAAV